MASRVIRRVFFVVLAATVSACGGDGGSTRVVNIVTAPPGGSWFVMGGALASVINDAVPGVQAVAEASGGAEENVRLVGTGQSNLGFVIGKTALQGYEGREPFGQPFTNLRMLMGNIDVGQIHAIVLEGSPLKDICQVKGQRVGVGPSGHGSLANLREIFSAACGFTFDDITPVYLPYDQALSALGDGRLDASMIYVSPPIPAIAEFGATRKYRLLPLSEAARDAVVARYPYYLKTVIPATAYAGITQEVPVVGTSNGVMVDAELPEDARLSDHQGDLREYRQDPQELPDAGEVLARGRPDGRADSLPRRRHPVLSGARCLERHVVGHSRGGTRLHRTRLEVTAAEGALGWSLTMRALLVGASVFALFANATTVLAPSHNRMVHWGLMATVALLSYGRNRTSAGTPRAVDLVLAALLAASTIFLILDYPSYILRTGIVTTAELVFGVVMILLVLETTRRMVGWFLVLMVLAALAYAMGGQYPRRDVYAPRLRSVAAGGRALSWEQRHLRSPDGDLRDLRDHVRDFRGAAHALGRRPLVQRSGVRRDGPIPRRRGDERRGIERAHGDDLRIPGRLRGHGWQFHDPVDEAVGVRQRVRRGDRRRGLHRVDVYAAAHGCRRLPDRRVPPGPVPASGDGRDPAGRALLPRAAGDGLPLGVAARPQGRQGSGAPEHEANPGGVQAT